ncbi:hypothetical protein Psta_3372 [Pirellula staleyi DSM 6068]|uniref:Uncharacterized protein n=1 Tax=Pirellula staleyi (strain ATCC 27377 / DSM 6068 / ICPB 4128) TaxID=530564 RepID=D2QXV9_PIRSD|nr:hypothetical protein [Pirellula staleyi]ADB18036.1 hypothetical protein Psta_3372 [Pirellula staleyi DSM 6068]
MRGLRFSMSGGLSALTLLSVLLALMVSKSEIAGSVALTVYISVVCLATAGAIATLGNDKLFWLGAAIFGWTYLFTEYEAVSSFEQMVQSPGVIMVPSGTSNLRPVSKMITSSLVELIEQNVIGSRYVGATVMARWRNGSYYSGTIAEIEGSNYLVKWTDGSAPQWTPGTQILSNSPGTRSSAHAILGTLFGLFGGMLVTLVFQKRETPAS